MDDLGSRSQASTPARRLDDLGSRSQASTPARRGSHPEQPDARLLPATRSRVGCSSARGASRCSPEQPARTVRSEHGQPRLVGVMEARLVERKWSRVIAFGVRRPHLHGSHAPREFLPVAGRPLSHRPPRWALLLACMAAVKVRKDLFEHGRRANSDKEAFSASLVGCGSIALGLVAHAGAMLDQHLVAHRVRAIRIQDNRERQAASTVQPCLPCAPEPARPGGTNTCQTSAQAFIGRSGQLDHGGLGESLDGNGNGGRAHVEAAADRGMQIGAEPQLGGIDEVVGRSRPRPENPTGVLGNAPSLDPATQPETGRREHRRMPSSMQTLARRGPAMCRVPDRRGRHPDELGFGHSIVSMAQNVPILREAKPRSVPPRTNPQDPRSNPRLHASHPPTTDLQHTAWRQRRRLTAYTCPDTLRPCNQETG